MKEIRQISNISLEKNYTIIEKSWNVLLAEWDIHYLDDLKALEELQNQIKRKVVFITPFCLAWIEKWYEIHWKEKIIALEVKNEIILTKDEIIKILPEQELKLWKIKSDISDLEFWKAVEEVKWEINNWEINQLIISREFFSKIELSNNQILTIFRSLLKNSWQYMTFLFNTPNKTFVWASPEKHLSIDNKKVVMNPIAWTFPKRDLNNFYKRFLDFLKDNKEIWELAMVIDEELKMISKITTWWKIEVPILKEIGAVIHTEWNLIWTRKNNISVLEAFAETLYAPTLVWGPLESAYKQIKKYEDKSREYYWGAFGIYDKDFLDTAIVIRTAFIDKRNSILTVRAWAWIVKDSNSIQETRETIVKSEWFYWSIKSKNTINSKKYLDSLDWEENIKVEKLLQERKYKLSKFYLEAHNWENLEVEEIKWKKFILINNWDDFVNLSWYMIERMWGKIDIISNNDFDINIINNYDIVLIWPWYWDINDINNEKMTKLLDITKKLIDLNKKIIWICLGHQAICKVKWFEIKKQSKITQWEQKEVTFNWKKELLWFYNSFSPIINWKINNWVEVFEKNRILNFKEENIYSTQSHPESIMSINWFNILKSMILELIKK